MRTAPLTVSSTVRRTFTSVSPPAKTQKRPNPGHALSTLTTSSMLSGAKNQKYPESVGRATAVPAPVALEALVQFDCTRNRASFKQSVVASGTHGPGLAGASHGWSEGNETRKAPSTVRLFTASQSSELAPQAPSSCP